MLAAEFGIADVDQHNAEALVRIWDHRIALMTKQSLHAVHMMTRHEWLDWVAFVRVGTARGWAWLQQT